MRAPAPVADLEPGAQRPPARGPLESSVTELREDLGELLFVARSMRARLRATGAQLEAARADLHRATLAALLAQIRSEERRYRAVIRSLQGQRARASSTPPGTPALVAELAAAKAAAADLLRSRQAVVAALATAADWQSPSFLSSGRPAVGRQGGRIAPHWSDYKRDRSLDAQDYEAAYRRELIDGPADVRVLLTSCGMAAFTTILAYLLFEVRPRRPVVIGRALYHECKGLVGRAPFAHVHEVDECDTAALVGTLRALRPGVVLLDTLCNTRWAPLPDLRAVVQTLEGTDAYLILDNTTLSTSFQPFRLAAEHGGGRLIVFESLLKYAQLGFDRANAGVLAAGGPDADALEHYREHLGTNVADVAVHALPPPSRHVLERRLRRLGRNARLIAERLSVAAGGAGVVRVVYPGLEAHPRHELARDLRFQGGCVGVASTPERERRFVAAALREARLRGVSLIAGSSFGFDTTRVYLTAATSEQGEPFVRIAAGTECRLAAEDVAETLAAAVREALR